MGKTNRKQGAEGILAGMSAGALISTAFVAGLAVIPVRVEVTPPPAHVVMTTARAEAQPEPATTSAETPPEPKLTLTPRQDPPEAVMAKMRGYATKYGVPYEDMHRVVACETGNTFDPSIQSYVPDPKGPDGREDSWGLAQINLPSHPNITREQATDPDFALAFMAEHFAKGNHWMWACWKIELE